MTSVPRTHHLWAALVVIACGQTSVAPDASTPDAATVKDVAVSDGNPCSSFAACTGIATPPTLASCQVVPSGLVVDDTNVYWSDIGHFLETSVMCGDGNVMKCAKAGCNAQPTTLASNVVPRSLAQLGGTLYFGSSNVLYGCSVNGCNDSPQTIIPSWGGRSITTDGTSLFWIDSNDISSCVPPCTAPTPLYSGTALSMAIDGTNLYIATLEAGTTTKVLTCPKAGCSGTPQPLVDASTYNLTTTFGLTLAVDGSNVYFGGAGGIGSCAKTGCASATTLYAPQADGGVDFVAQLTTDGTNIYWVEWVGLAVEVRKCPVTGCSGAPITIATTPSPPATGLAVDATDVYWVGYQNVWSYNITPSPK